MRIGVISDTHDREDNVLRIVQLMNAADVEWVVHTGDITTPATLAILGRLHAPLVGVFGNNDLDRASLGAAARCAGFVLTEGLASYAWAGVRVGVVHDPSDLTPEARSGFDVVLHGHTHRHVLETVEGTLVFNPGECAGVLEGYNRVGVLDLVSLEAELVKF